MNDKPIIRASQSPDLWLPRLLRLWSIASLVVFLVMLTHQSDDGSFAGRYSLSILVSIIALLLLSIIAWVASRLLTIRPKLAASLEAKLEDLRSRNGFTIIVVLFGCIGIGVVWWFLLGDHLVTYAVLRVFICLSIIVLASALLYGGKDSLPEFSRFHLAWIGLAVLLLIGLVTIQFYPALLNTDESSDFSMAVNAAVTGHLGPLIYRYSHPANYFGGIWTVIMGTWLRLVGISLTTGRLYILILAVGSLALLWKTAANLYDKTTAWFTVLIAAFTFISLNHIRYHIHAAFWLSLGLFFYSYAKKTGAQWAYLLMGFGLAMTIDSTPVAYAFGLGVGVFYLVAYVRHIRSEKRWFWSPFWLLGIGAGIAIALFILTHQNSAYASNQSTGSMISTYVQNTLAQLAGGRIPDMLRQYVTAYLTASPILTVLLIMGFIVVIRERNAHDLLLVVMFVMWTLVIIFTYVYFPSFYVVISLPVCAIIAGRGLARGIPWLLSSTANVTALTRLTTVFVVVWLVVAAGVGIRNLRSNSLEDLVETGFKIGQIVPKDAVVLAAEPYYFGLLDHLNFVGGPEIEFLTSPSFGRMSEKQAWSFLEPDAIVLSEAWPQPRRTPELTAYLDEQHFYMRQCYVTESYGRVELWVKADSSDTQTSAAACIPVCNPRVGCNNS